MTFDEWRETQLRSGQIAGPRAAYEAGAASVGHTDCIARMDASNWKGVAKLVSEQVKATEYERDAERERADKAEARVRELEAACVTNDAEAVRTLDHWMGLAIERLGRIERAESERDAALAQVAALREALEACLKADPLGKLHNPDCVGLFCYDCKEWCTGANVLADTARAAAEHDERVRLEACGCNCHGHEWGGELHPTHQDCREAIEEEREALVRAEMIGVRREALEEAEGKIGNRFDKSKHSITTIAFVYDVLRALAAESKDGEP